MEKHARDIDPLNEGGMNSNQTAKRKDSENSEGVPFKKRLKYTLPQFAKEHPENHHLKDFREDPWTIDKEHTFRRIYPQYNTPLEAFKNSTNYLELIRQHGGAQTRCVYIYIYFVCYM